MGGGGGGGGNEKKNQGKEGEKKWRVIGRHLGLQKAVAHTGAHGTFNLITDCFPYSRHSHTMAFTTAILNGLDLKEFRLLHR